MCSGLLGEGFKRLVLGFCVVDRDGGGGGVDWVGEWENGSAEKERRQRRRTFRGGRGMRVTIIARARKPSNMQNRSQHCRESQRLVLGPLHVMCHET